MKQFYFCSLLLFISVFSIQAQDSSDETDVYQFGAWSEEDISKPAFVFGDVSNIHKSADPKSKITERIAIGSEVEVLGMTTVNYTQNGITSPWVKVKTASATGYIWGAVLTKGSLKLQDGKTVLWGLKEILALPERNNTYASVRVVEKGILIDKHDFLVEYGDRPDAGSLTVNSAPQLNNVQNVIVFQTPSEACGVYASSHYFLYGQNELHFIGSGYSMGDGGVLHTSKSFVFPYPAKENENQSYHFTPNEGHVFCVEDNGTYDDDCIWNEIQKVADFIWEGNQLVKACDQ